MPPPKGGGSSIIWNGETDAKLLAAIMKHCEVKIGPAKAAINGELGLDPKSQAFEHRIRFLKKLAAGEVSNGGASPAKVDAKSTPTKRKAPTGTSDDDEEQAATPAPKKRAPKANGSKAASKKAKSAPKVTADDDEDAEGEPASDEAHVKAEASETEA